MKLIKNRAILYSNDRKTLEKHRQKLQPFSQKSAKSFAKGLDKAETHLIIFSNKQQATSNKQQATSNKQQATSNKQQATSNKQQATSNKQQATSNKQQADRAA
ncbi:hypothetical protein [Treponema denticola]|uniref:hypothetical protein n=1 Tax=Treponema denticola TaxID=158 RepID=UPI0020A5FEE0|nr:hypothetical protein [Treponema denticola]UTC88855.1 hypothetical protein E4N79_12200 [Treponema denticola]